MTQISVKVYYIENKGTKEIRKFVVDNELTENFEYLVGKIRSSFPDLLRKDLELFWKDDEDDYISISSNEELSYAVSGVPVDAACLKIFVKEKQEKSEGGLVEHPGVTCDGCDSNITGFRYKCTNCFNFDLCSSCQPKGLHPSDHEMICIKNPRTSTPVYVIRPPFGRDCHGGGPFGRSNPWEQCGPFGIRIGHCGRQQKTSCKKGSNKQYEASYQQNQEILEVIRQFALRLSFDPDVAESHFKLFLHNLGVQEEEKQQNGKNAERSNSNNENKKTALPSKEEDEKGDPIEPTEQKMNETKPQSSNNANETNPLPGNVEQIVSEFAQQLGFNPSQQGDNNPFDNLSEVVSKVFQSLSAATVPKQETDAKSENPENQQNKEEDFIVVDSNSSDTEQLTREQKYELRLQKAIKQMESMGFDNEGGWLRRLLVSKDLSIHKVLEALNPSN